MNRLEPTITPQEIRAIRESLGLTQVQAGKCLGGGPRAFAKYEAGTVKPAASLVRLLRLVGEIPDLLTRLQGRGGKLPRSRTPTLFAIGSQQISALSPQAATNLLRKLLHEEARANDLPVYGIHVASEINAADGGEDGRIRWKKSPSQTSFLPSRYCQFQLKSGNMSSTKAAREMVTSSGQVKPMLRKGFAEGAFYIMLCTKSYTKQSIDTFVSKMLKSVRDTGFSINDEQIRLWDATRIAQWVNYYSRVANWVRDETNTGFPEPFESWSQWAKRHRHARSPFVQDKRLHAVRTGLLRNLPKAGGFVRVIGLSGVGLSRLTLEALTARDTEQWPLSELVLYTAESEFGFERIVTAVRNLAASSTRAIVVVDECTDETRSRLIDIVRSQGCELSLVLIEDRNPDEHRDNHANSRVVRIDQAEDRVIESILRHKLPHVSLADRARLVKFSGGYPGIAHLVASTRIDGVSLSHASDDYLVEKWVLGRVDLQRDLQMKVASLLSVFLTVNVLQCANTCDEVAALASDLSSEHLYSATKRLIRRGVVKERGNNVLVRPIPIALHLAEHQWEEWPRERWDDVLVKHTRPEVSVAAARQLALINTTDVAKQVVEHVTRRDGFFQDWSMFSRPGRWDVLASLAEIDARQVIVCIERTFDGLDLAKVDGESRHGLVQIMTKIAFDTETFEKGAKFLLRLASSENNSWDDTATSQFAGLFPVYLGNTAADSEARLSLLRQASDASSPVTQRLVAVEALNQACKTGRFYRLAGPEFQGSRPALEVWCPSTRNEMLGYLRDCTELLAALATQDDRSGIAARRVLGDRLRSLVNIGLIETVETLVEHVGPIRGEPWPEARESLWQFLKLDNSRHDTATTERVRSLIGSLESARDIRQHVKMVVCEMPFNYLAEHSTDHEDLDRLQREAVFEIASNLVKQHHELEGLLPMLTKGTQRKTNVFGEAIAQHSDTPLIWMEPIKAATITADDSERNYSLLMGYIFGLSRVAPHVVENFKWEAVQSSTLAPLLPRLCWLIGIHASDISLVLSGLKAGHLLGNRLLDWLSGNRFAQVPSRAIAPLIKFLISGDSEAYLVGVSLLGYYGIEDNDRWHDFQTELLHIARTCSNWPHDYADYLECYLEALMKFALHKGVAGQSAKEVARLLTIEFKSLLLNDNEQPLMSIVALLFRRFPKTVWSILGAAIVSDQTFAMKFESVKYWSECSSTRDHHVVTYLHESLLFEWCHANPVKGPIFLARVAPLTVVTTEDDIDEFHPLLRRTIDEFGMNPDVMEAIRENISTLYWSDSKKLLLRKCLLLIRELSSHKYANVRNWADEIAQDIEASVQDIEKRRSAFESGLKY